MKIISLLKVDSKADQLRSPHHSNTYTVSASQLQMIPRSPFAYWLSEDVRRLFVELPSFGEVGGISKQGVATGDNGRVLRAWWEVPPSEIGSRWQVFVNGGRLSPFYGDVVQVIGDAEEDRIRIREVGRYGRGSTHYYRPGLTWAVRSARFAPSLMSAGSIFSNRGFTAYAPDGENAAWCGLFNSRIFDFLYKANLGRFDFPHYEMGVLPRVPVPDISGAPSHALAELAREGWALRRSVDTADEVSHAFIQPALLQVEGRQFSDRVAAWAERVAASEGRLVGIQAEIDELCFDLYGVSEQDRRAIVEGFGGTSGESADGQGQIEDDPEELDTQSSLDPVGLAAGLVSWAVGVAVGRFDVRLAAAEQSLPPEPDPFDPLPVCSPGMLVAEDGQPMPVLPAGYPVTVSPILVEDPGHPLDLGGSVRTVFDTIFGSDSDSWWFEAGEALDDSSRDVGSWLAKGFFDHHLRAYSRSRRRAPILWPLGTRSGSYMVWLYAHAASDDSLFRVLTDVVEPKIRAEAQQLAVLRQEAGVDPTASQRKLIHRQERFLDELHEMRAIIEDAGPLWAPNLNDGIVIALAPLWKLFMHHRAWSKELKGQWDRLVAGECDWSQLAMHLWPGRVVDRCASDRGLAVAHGLADVFWVQHGAGAEDWHARHEPTIPIEDLVADRTSPATAAALQRQT